MRKYKKVVFSVFAAAIFLAAGVSDSSAQSRPRPSQKQVVTQTVGTVEITIVYHRPNAKGREIFGKLVPFNEIWRAGANENTTFEVSGDVKIDGQTLPKGKYGFHAIPGESEWTLIFNKVNDVWGTVKPKPENDALRIKSTPEEGPFQESLAYLFEDVIDNGAKVVLSWDTLRVPFTIDTDAGEAGL